MDNINKITNLVKNCSNKHKILETYINHYSSLPEQGSMAWLKSRKGSPDGKPIIGGSEISTILGLNRYDINQKELAKRKLGISDFTGNIHTYWGNVFEDISRMITENIFKTKIYETGSIPGLLDNDGNLIQSYSPDGLGIVTCENFKKGLENSTHYIFNEQEFTDATSSNSNLAVLFEYKCPAIRIPNGIVPTHYKSQPKLGMCTIPFIDISLFVDITFRKVSVKWFGFNKYYDKYFHAADTRKHIEFNAPTMCGFIGIYDDSVPKNKYSLKVIIKNIKKSVNKEINLPTSKYYNLHIETSVISLITLIYKHLNKLSNKHNIYVSNKNKEKIIFIICRLMLKKSIEITAFIKEIIPDMLSYIAHDKDINNLDFGIDLGYSLSNNSTGNGCTTTEFENILKKVIDDRFNPGFKAYYPTEVCPEQGNPNKWLYNNVENFINFCKINQYKIIGILPWKIFNTCYTPIYKNINFMEKCAPLINNFTNTIYKIKQLAKDKTDKEKKQIYINEINKLKIQQKIKKSPINKSYINFNNETVINFNEETMNDFIQQLGI